MRVVGAECGSLRTLATGDRSGHALAGGDRRAAKPQARAAQPQSRPQRRAAPGYHCRNRGLSVSRYTAPVRPLQLSVSRHSVPGACGSPRAQRCHVPVQSDLRASLQGQQVMLVTDEPQLKAFAAVTPDDGQTLNPRSLPTEAISCPPAWRVMYASSRVHEPCILAWSGCPAVADGLDRFRESQILLWRVGRPPTFPPAYRRPEAESHDPALPAWELDRLSPFVPLIRYLGRPRGAAWNGVRAGAPK